MVSLVNVYLTAASFALRCGNASTCYAMLRSALGECNRLAPGYRSPRAKGIMQAMNHCRQLIG